MEINSKLPSYKLVTKAAKLLIERQKDPAAFLLAATDQTVRMSEFYGYMQDYHHNKDHSYTLSVIIQEIVPAWFTGGQKPLDSIIIALYKTMDTIGGEGFVNVAMDIMGGFGLLNTAYPGTGEAWYIKLGTDFTSFLVDMGEILEEAWELHCDERRKII